MEELKNNQLLVPLAIVVAGIIIASAVILVNKSDNGKRAETT